MVGTDGKWREGVKDYLTVQDVSHEIDLTERRIRELIRHREIRATKIGRWRIAREDLEAFIRSRTNVQIP